MLANKFFIHHSIWIKLNFFLEKLNHINYFS